MELNEVVLVSNEFSIYGTLKSRRQQSQQVKKGPKVFKHDREMEETERPMKNQHLLKEKPSPTKYLDKLGTVLATLRHPWEFFKHEFAGTTHLTTLNFKILFDSWILFFPLHYTGHGHPP